MSEFESTQGTQLTTEQIASAGADDERSASPDQYPVPSDELGLGPDQYPVPDAETQPPAQVQPGPVGSDLRPGDQVHPQLLQDEELLSIRAQWKDIQAEFVDEPRKAVQEADALVAELMQRLAQTFASEREELESRWAGGEDVSTDDLRSGLRRYRSFFERLLAA
jgi:hypothetical protein